MEDRWDDALKYNEINITLNRYLYDYHSWIMACAGMTLEAHWNTPHGVCWERSHSAIQLHGNVLLFFFPHERENEICCKSRQTKLGYFWMLCAKSLKTIINSATFPCPIHPNHYLNLFHNSLLWGWVDHFPQERATEASWIINFLFFFFHYSYW